MKAQQRETKPKGDAMQDKDLERLTKLADAGIVILYVMLTASVLMWMALMLIVAGV